MKQITELLKEEIDRLARIASSKEQLEAGAMAKLTECRGMLSSMHKYMVQIFYCNCRVTPTSMDGR